MENRIEPIAPMARMSSDHLAAWRENIAERVEFLSVEPATLVNLIDEVLEARALTITPKAKLAAVRG